MIMYADETTLYSTLDVFGNYISKSCKMVEVKQIINQYKKIQNHGISYAPKTSQYTKYRD